MIPIKNEPKDNDNTTNILLDVGVIGSGIEHFLMTWTFLPPTPHTGIKRLLIICPLILAPMSQNISPGFCTKFLSNLIALTFQCFPDQESDQIKGYLKGWSNDFQPDWTTLFFSMSN